MSAWRIFVVGRPGVGKTTLSRELATLLGVPHINSGESLRRYLRERGIEVRDVADTGAVFLSEFNETIAGAAIMDHSHGAEACVIDGVRLFSTFDYFRQCGHIVDVVYLSADENVRRRRFVARSIAEGEATVSNAHALLARKDAWDGDLERYERVSRWRFDNSGELTALLGFAAAVASEIGFNSTSSRASSE